MHFADPGWLLPLAAGFGIVAALALWTFSRDRRDLRRLGHRNLVLSPALAVLRRGLRGSLLLAGLALCRRAGRAPR